MSVKSLQWRRTENVVFRFFDCTLNICSLILSPSLPFSNNEMLIIIISPLGYHCHYLFICLFLLVNNKVIIISLIRVLLYRDYNKHFC